MSPLPKPFGIYWARGTLQRTSSFTDVTAVWQVLSGLPGIFQLTPGSAGHRAHNSLQTTWSLQSASPLVVFDSLNSLLQE